MPRQNRRREDAARRGGPQRRPPQGEGERARSPWDSLGTETVVYAGVTWSVRRVTGVRATRPYLCPGCSHEIGLGTPHVVVWPAEGVGGLGDRRHWHSGCWDRRHARPSGNSYR